MAGSQARLGTTTVAIGLCTWLARVGASVCYIEGNQSGHLAALVRGYEMEQETDGWKYEGVHYGRTEPQRDVNFHVYDLGDALSGRRDILECASLKPLVCGTKPYELGFSARLQREFVGMDAWLLCPFVADGVQEELTKAFQNEWHRVRFPGYQPELTDGGCNNGGLYKEIVAEYIWEKRGDKGGAAAQSRKYVKYSILKDCNILYFIEIFLVQQFHLCWKQVRHLPFLLSVTIRPSTF